MSKQTAERLRSALDKLGIDWRDPKKLDAYLSTIEGRAAGSLMIVSEGTDPKTGQKLWKVVRVN